MMQPFKRADRKKIGAILARVRLELACEKWILVSRISAMLSVNIAREFKGYDV